MQGLACRGGAGMWWVVSGSWVGRPEDGTEKMNRGSSQGRQ